MGRALQKAKAVAKSAYQKVLKNRKKLEAGVRKAIQTPAGKKVLHRAAKVVRKKVDAYLDKNPNFKKMGKKALSNKYVQKGLKKAEAQMRVKCPSCGDVLDILK